MEERHKGDQWVIGRRSSLVVYEVCSETGLGDGVERHTICSSECFSGSIAIAGSICISSRGLSGAYMFSASPRSISLPSNSKENIFDMAMSAEG